MKISEMIKNLEEFKKEHGDLDCWYATDDEGNGYHTLFYSFTDDKDSLQCILEYEHDRTHTVDNCVCLG